MHRVKLVFYQLELHLGKSNLWTWQVGRLKFKTAFLSYEKVIAGYDKKKNKTIITVPKPPSHLPL